MYHLLNNLRWFIIGFHICHYPVSKIFILVMNNVEYMSSTIGMYACLLSLHAFCWGALEDIILYLICIDPPLEKSVLRVYPYFWQLTKKMSLIEFCYKKIASSFFGVVIEYKAIVQDTTTITVVSWV